MRAPDRAPYRRRRSRIAWLTSPRRGWPSSSNNAMPSGRVAENQRSTCEHRGHETDRRHAFERDLERVTGARRAGLGCADGRVEAAPTTARAPGVFCAIRVAQQRRVASSRATTCRFQILEAERVELLRVAVHRVDAGRDRRRRAGQRAQGSRPASRCWRTPRSARAPGCDRARRDRTARHRARARPHRRRDSDASRALRRSPGCSRSPLSGCAA